VVNGIADDLDAGDGAALRLGVQERDLIIAKTDLEMLEIELTW